MTDKELFERWWAEWKQTKKYFARLEDVARAAYAAALREREQEENMSTRWEETAEHLVEQLEVSDERLHKLKPVAWMVTRTSEGMHESPEFFLTLKAAEQNATLGMNSTHITALYAEPSTQPTPQPSTEAAKELDDAIRAVYEFRPERDIPGESQPESGKESK